MSLASKLSILIMVQLRVKLIHFATDMATVKYSQSFQGREGARNPHTFPSRNTHTFLKEGVLYKRQRGRKSHDLRGLKFQQRYCVLAPSMFAYYSSKRVSRLLIHSTSGIVLFSVLATQTCSHRMLVMSPVEVYL